MFHSSFSALLLPAFLPETACAVAPSFWRKCKSKEVRVPSRNARRSTGCLQKSRDFAQDILKGKVSQEMVLSSMLGEEDCHLAFPIKCGVRILFIKKTHQQQILLTDRYWLIIIA